MKGIPDDELRRQLIRLAFENGWTRCQHRPDERVLIFWKFAEDSFMMHVRYRDMTVTTELWHPRWNTKRRLSRERVSLEMFARIAANPRAHTGAGFYE